MRVLILDDEVYRVNDFGKSIHHSHTVEWVFSAREAIESMSRDTYDWVFLDHDLGARSDFGSGTDVAKWLSGQKMRETDVVIDEANSKRMADTQFVIHSMNSVAAMNMYHHILSNKVFSRYPAIIPCAWIKDNIPYSLTLSTDELGEIPSKCHICGGPNH